MKALQAFLGSQVKVFRDMRELSQIELADSINVSRETIGKIERGAAAPSFRTIDKLCRKLGISPRSLFPAEKYIRHQPASTAMENLVTKASKLTDAEVNWIIDLIEIAEKKP